MFDDKGLACLNDIHRAAGFSKNQRPSDWMRLPTTHKLIEAVLNRVTGKSRNWEKSEYRSVTYTKVGVGTFADVRLALAYAEYLNPNLAVEVREVFLRYKAGDATLADETLQRASPEANEWAAKRAMGRVVRNEYTGELSERGVREGYHYANCTNETYKGLFGKTAKQMKNARQLQPNDNLRDAMTMKEIAFVAASEALSVERMQDEQSSGYTECRDATAKASQALSAAIEQDRKNRRLRML
ncbi:MAG: KilA-N domain-containing protein [Pseudomonadota bacterium]